MRSRLFALCAALGTAFVLALPALADGAVEILLRNARYWTARGRDDKAAEAWAKVLLSEPGDAEALAALGAFHARAGRLTEARELLNRLKKAHPDSADALTLERAIAVGKDFDAILAGARSAMKSNRPAQALEQYKRLFGDSPPPRHLALEYYQTMAGAPAGWEPAKKGLEGLVARAPMEPLYRLALARHLTYREESRREGIKGLAAIDTDPSAPQPVVEEAAAAWKQALLWLNGSPGDDALFDGYLARHREDAEVQKKREAVRSTESRSSVRAGFEALKRQDTASADKHFKAGGADVEAMLGHALVALKRQEFERARELLLKVKELAPAQPQIWEKSLRSATFWSLMAEARRANARGDEQKQEELYDRAMKSSSEEAPFAQAALGAALLDHGQPARAVEQLRAALEARPSDADSLRALIVALLKLDRSDEAQDANDQLAQVDAKKAFKRGWIEAETLRVRATADREARRLESARGLLLAAREADPGDQWVLHDLANLMLVMGETAAAREAYDRLADVAPELTATKVTAVHVLAAEERWAQSLEALRGLPRDEVTPELRALKRRLEFNVEVGQLLRRAARGRREAARQELAIIQQRAQGQPEAQAVVAEAWSSLGEHRRAVALMREAVASSPQSPPGLRLQLGAILLKAGDDAQLTGVLSDLTGDPTLSPREVKGLATLRVAHAVRRADKLREDGEFALAFDQLQPLLVEFPNDAKLLCALGRVFQSGDRPREGHAIFMRQLVADADNLEARQGAIETALLTRDLQLAKKLAAEVLERAPLDPRVQLLAGRLSVRLAEDGDAMEHFREAQLRLHESAAEALGVRPALALSEDGEALSAGSSTAAILRDATRWFGGGERRGASLEELGGDALGREIQLEIDRVRSRHLVELTAPISVDYRDGLPGLGQMSVLRAPAEASVPLGFRGRLGLRLTPVLIDAGTLDLANPQIARTFGSAALPDPSSQQQFAERASGTELRLGYSEGGLLLDVGTTPLGFPLRTVVGGLAYRYEGSSVGFAIDASRRAVQDSLLSYAGMRDPISGEMWGGVVRQGGRLDLAVTQAPSLFYVYGGYYDLRGTNVRANSQAIAGAGVEWKLYDWNDVSIVSGLSAHGIGYARNLRYFTLGQGGYFSPRAFVRAGIPLAFRGTSGKLKWEAALDTGANWFREGNSPYFPNDPALQAAQQAGRDAAGQPLPSTFADRTSLAFALDAKGSVRYPIFDQLEAGVEVQLHRADDYQQVSVGAVLTYSFKRRDATTAVSPSSSLAAAEAR